MQQDFLLVRKMQSGDEVAMEEFIQKYYPQILQYCTYHCPDNGWAQDLTQETFEHFFRSLAKYRNQGKVLNYLYTIARNLCIDWTRKNKKMITENSERAEESIENAAEETDMAGSITEKLLIETALAKLPEELREVVILHYFQGRSMREAAAILQIGVPLVKYRMKKAKEMLKGLLGNQ